VIPDAILFAVSAPNLSKRRLEQLRADTSAASPVPSMLIRLEDTGTSLPQALDMLSAAGHQTILVQPLGLPFTESLLAWLPGAAASWRASSQRMDVDIRIGREIGADAGIIAGAVTWSLDHAEDAEPVATVRPSLGKPGWQNPPDFTYHLLVCTGPRCQYRDAASLLHSLKDETARQGISDQCLTARTGCLFPCNQGPMVAVYPRGEWYRLPDADSVRRFVGEVLVKGETVSDLLIHTAKSLRRPSIQTQEQHA
jgi:(2Fe-2S) ferredoxin